MGCFEASRIRWWQIRRRRQRYKMLEQIASTEIRVSLDHNPVLTATFEQAYLAVKYGAYGEDTAVGVMWLRVLTMRDESGHDAAIELRAPLPIRF